MLLIHGGHRSLHNTYCAGFWKQLRYGEVVAVVPSFFFFYTLPQRVHLEAAIATRVETR